VTPTPAPPPPVAETKATAPAPAVVDVFFDFDKSTIRQDQQTALQELIAELKQHTGMKLTVEGHCDERGASEYNLALGERRANSVKAALLKAGVAADRIATVSYGEERPFVRGKDESAWKWNRRAHFVLSGE
jgi:peptidoglycan-associated lipoprotein